MDTLLQALETVSPGEIQMQAPLAPYTTYRVGGLADALVIPKDATCLIELLALLARLEVDRWTLGGGSNVLVSDNGVRGVVLKLGRAFRGFHQIPTSDSDDTILIEAGASGKLSTLVKGSMCLGATDLTGLAGIPGTVGGAVAGNAGTKDTDMAKVVEWVKLATPEGLVTLNNQDLQFSYRSAHLPRDGVITSIGIRSKMDDPKEAINLESRLVKSRACTQPKGRTAGSVFKNPPGDHAGRLLEQAGLKGFQVGGAIISPKHANFIINKRCATARDIESLMKTAQEKVHKIFGIILEPETILMGFEKQPQLSAQELKPNEGL